MKEILAVIVAAKEETPELRQNFESQYPDVDIIIIGNNQADSLAEKYNIGIEEVIKRQGDNEGWVVFQHDDARTLMTVRRMEEALDEVPKDAVQVGVAGSTKVPPLSPGFWWHGIGTPQFGGSGRVEHVIPEADPHNAGKRTMTAYGVYPNRVAALDGVWTAVDYKTLTEQNLRYDANTFDGYHYYDADFSAQIRSKGLKLYVCDVVISHDSGGESMRNASFAIAQNKFVKKWMAKQKAYNLYE